mmetsp:Transcript_40543/g.80081  ORF Transcript_40543/g.80081 Transcript_40543/m.80081 type:complete len:562 (-) Transcript_40543:259-1944(-)
MPRASLPIEVRLRNTGWQYLTTAMVCAGAMGLWFFAKWRGAAISSLRLALDLRRSSGIGVDDEASKPGSAVEATREPIVTADEPGTEHFDLEDIVSVGTRPGKLGAKEVRRQRWQKPVSSAPPREDLHVPGRGRIYVQTHGCQHNQSDGEYMMGQLQDYGYTLVNSIEECDVCVVNSCTVKTPSEERGLSLVTRARESGKQVVLAGCVPSGDKSLVEKFKDVSMLHVTQLDRIVDVVEEASKGHTVTLIQRRTDLPSLELPRVRKDKLSEIITINAGCLGNCTYCKTKMARGTVVSYPIDAIVARALKAAGEGVRYIELASEDMGAYGIDIGANIADLLLKLSDALPEGVMLRTGMTNPPYIMQHIDGVIKALQRPNVYSFMHLPVQSGSNAVLQGMRREYTVEDFSYVVDRLRAAIPDIYILTDIICGFPHESDEDWADTMALVQKYKFPGIYSSRFFARVGTPAAKWRQLLPRVIKARYQELVEFTQTLEDKNADLPGKTERVWFCETEKVRGQTVGRTKSYAKVIVPRDDALLGRSALVQMKTATVKHVEGEVVGHLI